MTEQQRSRLHSAALLYAEKGIPVYPVSPRGKAPLIKGGHGFRDATLDLDQIDAWWIKNPQANIGTCPGAIGLSVFDIDRKPGKPDGFEVWDSLDIDTDGCWIGQTGGGGRHYWFLAPDGGLDSRDAIAPGVDFKSDGGAIILPPSVHASGERYEWEEGSGPLDYWPTQPLPAIIVEMVNAARNNGSDPAAKGQAAPVGDTIPEGERSSSLISLAGSMRRRNMSEAAILAAIGAENEARCDPPMTDSQIAGIVKSVLKYPASDRQREPKSAEYIAALAALGYTFRLNLCSDILEVNEKPLSDPEAAEIQVRMLDLGYGKARILEKVYLAEGFKKAYHPVKDYLTGLDWDGEDHIGLLFSHFQDKDGAFQFWLKRWIVGAVAKVMEAGQNAMLVLAGPQGLGKSFFVKWLCPLDAYFVEGPIDPSNKDHVIRMADGFIWEVGELGSSMRKADREALKFIISMKMVVKRRPYGRYDTRKPAMASLVGTLNNEGGFLNDPTGSRRFLVSTLTAIDWAYSKEVDVHQVWAQAMALYRQGEPWELLPEERKFSADLNKGYKIDDPIENALRVYFDIDPAKQEWWISSHDIITELQTNGGLHGNTIGLSRMLSATLTGLGLERSKYKDNRGYRGIQRKGTMP